jgi:hypothetical protein
MTISGMNVGRMSSIVFRSLTVVPVGVIRIVERATSPADYRAARPLGARSTRSERSDWRAGKISGNARLWYRQLRAFWPISWRTDQQDPCRRGRQWLASAARLRCGLCQCQPVGQREVLHIRHQRSRLWRPDHPRSSMNGLDARCRPRRREVMFQMQKKKVRGRHGASGVAFAGNSSLMLHSRSVPIRAAAATSSRNGRFGIGRTGTNVTIGA